MHYLFLNFKCTWRVQFIQNWSNCSGNNRWNRSSSRRYRSEAAVIEEHCAKHKKKKPKVWQEMEEILSLWHEKETWGGKTIFNFYAASSIVVSHDQFIFWLRNINCVSTGFLSDHRDFFFLSFSTRISLSGLLPHPPQSLLQRQKTAGRLPAGRWNRRTFNFL